MHLSALSTRIRKQDKHGIHPGIKEQWFECRSSPGILIRVSFLAQDFDLTLAEDYHIRWLEKHESGQKRFARTRSTRFMRMRGCHWSRAKANRAMDSCRCLAPKDGPPAARLLFDHTGFYTRDLAVRERICQEPLLIEAFDLPQPPLDR